MERLEYPYRPAARLIAPLLFVCGGLGAYATYLALGNNGMAVMGLIELGPEAAHKLWIVSAIVLAVGFTLGVVLLATRLAFAHHLVIDDEGIELPVNAFRAPHHRIPFSSIERATPRTIGSTRYLTLTRRGEKRVVIDGARLPTVQAYERVVARVTERIPAR